MELCVVILCLATASTIVAGSLAHSSGRSEKIQCLNNLRQIGQGFDAWRLEHGDFLPWHLDSSDGGSRSVSVGTPWIEFTFLSNTVPTPQILVCPSDRKRLPRSAENWGNGTTGFANSGNRNNSLSYTVGLHGFFNASQEFLCSDRDLRVDFANGSCGPSGISGSVAGINQGSTGVGAWTNELHALGGNFLLNDGHTAEMTTPQLKDFFRAHPSDTSVLHLLIP